MLSTLRGSKTSWLLTILLSSLDLELIRDQGIRHCLGHINRSNLRGERSVGSSRMVHVVTFVGLCAFTCVGVKALDNLVVWIAERWEANEENFKLERKAATLRQQLVKEIQEKHATT